MNPEAIRAARRLASAQPGLAPLTRAIRWGLGLSLVGGSTFAAYDLSQPDSKSFLRAPLNSFRTQANSMLGQFSWYQSMVQKVADVDAYMHRPVSKKLLPDLPTPPPGYVNRPTLVLGVEGVLLYPKYERGRGFRYQKRPNVDYFLSELSKQYEVVLFSSEPMMNISHVLERLDPNHFAAAMLFRDGCDIVADKVFIKDLANLNRDLGRTILVDCDPNAFKRQPENAIAVQFWDGDLDDNQLFNLLYYLKALSKLPPGTDVRKVMGAQDPQARLQLALQFAENAKKKEAELAEEKKKQQQRASKSIFARNTNH
jgi:import inner membrane translocase subunit TIM50